MVSRIRPGTGISKSGGTSCAAAWEDEYSRRARIMMRTWSRFGGRVLWMTLPAPGDLLRVAQFAAVNTAISHAAAHS